MQRNNKAPQVFFKDVLFEISINKKPEFIINKMKLGSVMNKRLILNAYECLYLYEKKVIRPLDRAIDSTEGVLSLVASDTDFLNRFMVYSFLKSKGLHVNPVDHALFWDRNSRRPMKGPVIVISEDQKIGFSDLFLNSRHMYAAIDDDYGITMFTSELIDIRGDLGLLLSDGIEVENINGINVTSEKNVPEWFGNRFSDLKILNKFEATLLPARKSETKIDSNLALETFKDLVSRGFIVRSGFKYGANFRLYSKSIEEHAKYLVHVIEEPEEWYKISRAVRVAQGVRKVMVFAGKIDEKIVYIKINRIKDPFFSDQT